MQQFERVEVDLSDNVAYYMLGFITVQATQVEGGVCYQLMLASSLVETLTEKELAVVGEILKQTNQEMIRVSQIKGGSFEDVALFAKTKVLEIKDRTLTNKLIRYQEQIMQDIADIEEQGLVHEAKAKGGRYS